MDRPDDIRARFLRLLGAPFIGTELFDAVPDTVFFVKDGQGRYMVVNRTLVERVGLRRKDQLIGRTAQEVFAGSFGARFAAQDRAVLRDGKTVNGVLELHFYPGRREGWCLTWKVPLRGPDGRIVGLSGLSRDLQPAAQQADTAGLSRALDHARENLDRPLRLPELAALAGLSVFQFDQRVRALFGLSAGQYITRARIEQACSLLRQGASPISRIAQECGYGDQAAFTRQFRKSVGLTPKRYRDQLREGARGRMT